LEDLIIEKNIIRNLFVDQSLILFKRQFDNLDKCCDFN